MSEESELVARSRTGDVDAYDQLVGRYQDRVYQLAYRVTGNREDAWDAAQDAFLKAYRALRGFRGAAAFGTWLHRIAVNTALDLVRRRPQPTLALHAVAAAAPDEPDETVLRQDVQQQVQRAIAALPPQHRVVVVLRDIDGLRYEEIAGLLQVPVGTVRSRLSRARDALRRHLAGLASVQEI